MHPIPSDYAGSVCGVGNHAGRRARRRPDAGHLEDEHPVHHRRGLEREHAGLLRQSHLQDAEPGPLRHHRRPLRLGLRAGRLLQSLAHLVPDRPASAHQPGLEQRPGDGRAPAARHGHPAGVAQEERASTPPSSASSSTRSNTPRSNCWPSTGSRATASRRDGKGPVPSSTFPPVKRAQRDPAPKDKNSKEYREWRARNSDRYGDSGLAPEEEGDYRNAQIACALLKEFAQTKKQFFLSVHQSRPHTPLIAPKKYIDMYDPAKIPDPPAPPNVETSLYPRRVTVGNPDIFTNRQPTPQQVKEAIAAYYACVSFVDNNIGMILDELEKQGLAENTIVFILGDHGFHLGDHGFWSKYSMLESTRRAPLWVRVPGAPANGQVCREFVEFVDFVPTVGELVGLDLPANLEGLSFVPLLANPSRPWKKAVFMVENETNQVVRTRQFSYLEFGKGPVPAALFDLEKDPWETVNLADDPAYAKTRQEMAELLKAGWKAALPERTTLRQ